MTEQTQKKQGKLIIIGIIALAVAAFVIFKFSGTTQRATEDQLTAWAKDYLKIYEPFIKSESADISVSPATSSVTFKNMVYSVQDVPDTIIKISELSFTEIDYDTVIGNPGETSTMDKITMSGFSVMADQMKLPVIEMAFYEVGDVALPYRALKNFVPAVQAMQQKDATGYSRSAREEEVLALLMPIIANPNAKVGSVAMRDFKINMMQADAFDFRIASYAATGGKLLDRAKDGYDASLQKMTINGITFAVGDYYSIYKGSLDSFEINDLKYNYKELFDVLNDTQTPLWQKEQRLMEAMTATLYNYEFSGMAMEKFAFSGEGLNLTIESLKNGPRNLQKQGPDVIKNIRASFEGREVFALEALGVDKIILSDVLVDILKNPHANFESRLMGMAMTDPFAVLKGLQVDNFYIKNMNVPGYVAIDSWRGDLSCSKTLELKSKLAGLRLSGEALKNLRYITYDRDIRKIIDTLALNPEGVNLDSSFGINVSPAIKVLSYGINFDIIDKSFGSFAFDITGKTDSADDALGLGFGEPLVEKFSFSVEDFGILDTFFQAYARDMSGYGETVSPVELRKELISELDGNIAFAEGNELKIMQGLRSFLEKGGKFSATFTASQPITMDRLGRYIDDPDAFNVEIKNK